MLWNLSWSVLYSMVPWNHYAVDSSNVDSEKNQTRDRIPDCTEKPLLKKLQGGLNFLHKSIDKNQLEVFNMTNIWKDCSEELSFLCVFNCF